MTAFEVVRDRLVQVTGQLGRPQGRNLRFPCPNHDDTKPSLDIMDGGGRCLILCRAGCDTRGVLARLDLTERDLYDHPKGRDLANYQYINLQGKPGRVVHRRADKGFIQSGDKTHNYLYQLPWVVAQVEAGGTVYLVEGEADADALASVDQVATTAPQGADSFSKVDVSPLKGATVIAVRDRDEGGMKWSDDVRRRLNGFAAKLTIVEAKEGKDASDHLLYGHSVDDFVPVEYEEDAKRHLVTKPASQIPMRNPKWLYDMRIPANMITLLAGREGIGKSLTSCDLAARTTNGTLDGRYHNQPRSVGIIATEDAWAEVVVPRLKAAGADLDRVYQIEARTEDNASDIVSVPKDLAALRELCEEQDIALVIIDPLMSVIGDKIDTHKDRDVRTALDPLARFARETHVAVLGLIHVNKVNTTDPLNSIMASKAFTATARSILFCVTDPEVEQEDRYLFGHVKSNLGPKQATLQYRIVSTTFELPPVEGQEDPTIRTAKIVWGGEDKRTIHDVMETAAAAGRPQSELTVEILDWVRAQGRTVTTKEAAAAFPEEDAAKIRKYLSRLVDRGYLYRPGGIQAHYAVVVTHVLSDTVETDVSGVSNSETPETYNPLRQ